MDCFLLTQSKHDNNSPTGEFTVNRDKCKLQYNPVDTSNTKACELVTWRHHPTLLHNFKHSSLVAIQPQNVEFTLCFQDLSTVFEAVTIIAASMQLSRANWGLFYGTTQLQEYEILSNCTTIQGWDDSQLIFKACGPTGQNMDVKGKGRGCKGEGGSLCHLVVLFVGTQTFKHFHMAKEATIREAIDSIVKSTPDGFPTQDTCNALYTAGVRLADTHSLGDYNLHDGTPHMLEIRPQGVHNSVALLDKHCHTVPLLLPAPSMPTILVYTTKTAVGDVIDLIHTAVGGLVDLSIAGDPLSTKMEMERTIHSYGLAGGSTLQCFLQPSSPPSDGAQDMLTLEEQAARAFARTMPPLIAGEKEIVRKEKVTRFVERVGRAVGRLIITQFRIIFLTQDKSTYDDVEPTHDFDIPLGMIEKIKSTQFPGVVHATSVVELTCKNICAVGFGWKGDGGAALAKQLKSLVFPKSDTSFFAFSNQERYASSGWDIFDAQAEYKRLGLVAAPFRLTNINASYTLCPSYPPMLVVPLAVGDDSLLKVASFRDKGRIPAVIWRHSNGATLTRCSQPCVGLGRARCKDDEILIAQIQKTNPNTQHMYLVDSRPYYNAMANTLKGRGSEFIELYQGCEQAFLGIGNIHVMRESYRRLVDLCLSRNADEDDQHWLPSLAGTGWLEHVRSILRAANIIADLLDRKGCSVVTHCSDGTIMSGSSISDICLGWDRTSQLASLAEVLLDPFYRTIKGFEILIEKEWLAFGHMFGARSGHGQQGRDKESECAPIFLLFLDCVWQLMQQFSTRFEFNENLLITVMDAIYSYRFGTFLCNNDKERSELRTQTVSLWAYINNNIHAYTNPYYNVASVTRKRALQPCTYLPRILFWCGYYLRYNRNIK